MGGCAVSPARRPAPLEFASIVLSIVALVVSISTCHTSENSDAAHRSASAAQLVTQVSALLEPEDRPTDFLPTPSDLRDAEADLREAVALTDDTAETYYAWALYHYWGKESENAMDALQHAIAKDPNHYESVLFMSRIHRESGNADKSVIAVYDLTQNSQELPRSMIELVRIYLEHFRISQSDDDRARLQSGINALDDLIPDRDTHTYASAIVMSQAHRALSNIDNAKLFATMASIIHPNSVEPIVEYARAEATTDPRDSIGRLEIAIEDHPDALQVYEVLAELYVLECDNKSLYRLDTIAKNRLHLSAMEVIERSWMIHRSTCTT